MSVFLLEISYSQVAVFGSMMDRPFNDWTSEHVAQGFAWRHQSVSFGTLESAGTLRVEVSVNTTPDINLSSAVRIIQVPFVVTDIGDIEIASIGSSASLRLNPGLYELTFEHGRNDDDGMWAHLHFRPVEKTVEPTILRADDELNPPEPLVMIASPA
jgi:hypothetical protein